MKKRGIVLELAESRSRHPQYMISRADGMLLEANAAFLGLFGYCEEDARRLKMADFVEPAGILDAEHEADAWARCRKKDGAQFVMGQTSLDFVLDGKAVTVFSMWDTSLQEKVLNRLQLSEQIFATALDGIMVTDSQGIIQYVNPAFIRNTGYEAEELFGMTPRIFQSGRHSEEFYRGMWDALIAKSFWKGEIWNRRKDGVLIPEWLAISSMRDAEGKTLMYTAMYRDLSERYKYEEQITYQAQHDALTGLPNRRFFHEKLRESIATAKINQMQFGLLFMDLDGFKVVNDTLGHKAGDRILQVAAERIGNCVGDDGTAFRMGGDEFTVLLGCKKSDGIEAAKKIAGSILDAMSQPVAIWGEIVEIGISIGVAVYPDDGADEDAILMAADDAMYAAKHKGKNRICRFNE
jgi:diguanylate cyclase (GGDEF)-like protein/PAS domain S-box-containing protein